MSDTQPTSPPPTPVDALVSKTITALFVLGLFLAGAITFLVATDKSVPDVLGTMLTVAITALATLLAGRTRP
jgi:Na+/pantothenate symporter